MSAYKGMNGGSSGDELGGIMPGTPTSGGGAPSNLSSALRTDSDSDAGSSDNASGTSALGGETGDIGFGSSGGAPSASQNANSSETQGITAATEKSSAQSSAGTAAESLSTNQDSAENLSASTAQSNEQTQRGQGESDQTNAAGNTAANNLSAGTATSNRQSAGMTIGQMRRAALSSAIRHVMGFGHSAPVARYLGGGMVRENASPLEKAIYSAIAQTVANQTIAGQATPVSENLEA
jgi:hypothetical protein